jgi:hypothetical protein
MAEHERRAFKSEARKVVGDLVDWLPQSLLLAITNLVEPELTHWSVFRALTQVAGLCSVK